MNPELSLKETYSRIGEYAIKNFVVTNQMSPEQADALSMIFKAGFATGFGAMANNALRAFKEDDGPELLIQGRKDSLLVIHELLAEAAQKAKAIIEKEKQS